MDAEYLDSWGVAVDLVDDAVRAPSRRPESFEFPLERVTHAAGVVSEGADHELDHGCGDSLR